MVKPCCRTGSSHKGARSPLATGTWRGAGPQVPPVLICTILHHLNQQHPMWVPWWEVLHGPSPERNRAEGYTGSGYIRSQTANCFWKELLLSRENDGDFFLIEKKGSDKEVEIKGNSFTALCILSPCYRTPTTFVIYSWNLQSKAGDRSICQF